MCGRPSSSMNITFALNSMTGCTGEGWYIYFDSAGGSPRQLDIMPRRLDPAIRAVLVLPYPAGTNFVISSNQSASWMWRENRFYTRVNSLADVLDISKQTVYYFDDTNLYIGLQLTYYVAADVFSAGGVYLPGFDSSHLYINADCAANASGFCTVPKVIPPSIHL